MFVDKIYEQLRERYSRLSKSKFSKNYLNKDRNYWFVCRYKKTEISNTALMSLYGNLRRNSDIFLRLSSERDSRGSEHCLDGHVFMDRLADCVLNEIERRAAL